MPAVLFSALLSGAAGPACAQPIATHQTAQADTDRSPPSFPAAQDEDAPGTDEMAGSDGAETELRAPLPQSLSPWGLFLAADRMVKTVMLVLGAASVVTWTVWLVKAVELGAGRAAARDALRGILTSRTLDEAVSALRERDEPGAFFVLAAAEEVDLSRPTLDIAPNDGLKERVASRLGRIEADAARRMARGTGLLATIGSTGPFVGLFGAVWGIMDAFVGISEAQTTNLAVAAPGIAEALLATAFGLLAAIPAVVIYNAFARSIAGYRQLLAEAQAGVERLVSRDLDFRAVERAAAS